MEFQVGGNWDAFQRYYRTLDDLHTYYQRVVIDGAVFWEVGDTEARIVRADPSHLILWLVDETVVGHTVWHETSTDEHRPGDAREAEDKALLRDFFGGKHEGLAELHEVWLKTEHRGKGYGV